MSKIVHLSSLWTFSPAGLPGRPCCHAACCAGHGGTTICSRAPSRPGNNISDDCHLSRTSRDGRRSSPWHLADLKTVSHILRLWHKQLHVHRTDVRAQTHTHTNICIESWVTNQGRPLRAADVPASAGPTRGPLKRSLVASRIDHLSACVHHGRWRLLCARDVSDVFVGRLEQAAAREKERQTREPRKDKTRASCILLTFPRHKFSMRSPL